MLHTSPAYTQLSETSLTPASTKLSTGSPSPIGEGSYSASKPLLCALLPITNFLYIRIFTTKHPEPPKSAILSLLEGVKNYAA